MGGTELIPAMVAGLKGHYGVVAAGSRGSQKTFVEVLPDSADDYENTR